MSARQVKRILGSEAQELPTPKALTALEFTLPRNPLEASPRRARAGVVLWLIVRVAARILGVQPAHLAPHLNLVFEKTEPSAGPS